MVQRLSQAMVAALFCNMFLQYPWKFHFQMKKMIDIWPKIYRVIIRKLIFKQISTAKVAAMLCNLAKPTSFCLQRLQQTWKYQVFVLANMPAKVMLEHCLKSFAIDFALKPFLCLCNNLHK